MFESTRMNCAGIDVRREIERLTLHHQTFIELREQHEAAERRLGCRHQQAVIAARICARYAAAGVAAQPVGFQPFESRGRLPVHLYLDATAESLVTAECALMLRPPHRRSRAALDRQKQSGSARTCIV